MQYIYDSNKYTTDILLFRISRISRKLGIVINLTRFKSINMAISANYFIMCFAIHVFLNSSPLFNLIRINCSKVKTYLRWCKFWHIYIYMLGIRRIKDRRGETWSVVRNKLSQNGQRIAAFLRGEGAMRGPWRVAGPVGPQCVREHVGPMACSRGHGKLSILLCHFRSKLSKLMQWINWIVR